MSYSQLIAGPAATLKASKRREETLHAGIDAARAVRRLEALFLRCLFPPVAETTPTDREFIGWSSATVCYFLLKYSELIDYPSVKVVVGSASFLAGQPVAHTWLTVGANSLEIFDPTSRVHGKRPVHLVWLPRRDLVADFGINTAGIESKFEHLPEALRPPIVATSVHGSNTEVDVTQEPGKGEEP